MENGFLTTRENRTILFRFIADITEVSRMDDMFCEGLACRMATEMQPTLAPDLAANKAMLLRADYKTYMGEARIVNAIV